MQGSRSEGGAEAAGKAQAVAGAAVLQEQVAQLGLVLRVDSVLRLGGWRKGGERHPEYQA
ncbi:hypothetical protein D9M73_169230 [compost metagenome]